MTAKTDAAPVRSGSIADMNVRRIVETPIEVEVETSLGWLIFLKVIGSHSDTVRKHLFSAADEQQKDEVVQAVKNSKARPESAIITPLAKVVDRGNRAVARRIVGWRGPQDTEGLTPEQLEKFWGITNAYSFEAALELVDSDPAVGPKVLEAADDVGLFTKKSPQS
jgi:hypothetical protein